MNSGYSARGVVEWAVAGQALDGQAVSGDLHVVQAFERGVLLGVVDGVGHGEQARAAARAAIDVLGSSADQPVAALIRKCHDALLKTRGVVMTIASLQWPENTMTWLGVGNVEGRLLRNRSGFGPYVESVLLRGGMVGYQIPPLHQVTVLLEPGDLIVFASDGLQADFDSAIDFAAPAEQIAGQVLARNFKGTDDGLALVARYHGKQHE